jgi:hypothetical protein
MPARILRLSALVLLAECLSASPLDAQQKEVQTVAFEGPEIFTYLLHSAKIQPITSIEELKKDPSHAAVIVMGNPSPLAKLHQEFGSLRRMVFEGCTLCVATDDPVNLLEFGHTCSGLRIAQETGGYRREPQCPNLSLVETPLPGGPKPKVRKHPSPASHPLFQSLQKPIATNRPSFFSVMPLPDGLQPLQEIRNAWDVDTKSKLAGRYVYMAGTPSNAPGPARVLLIAGQGMFMNGMMLQHDNDNYVFTQNAVRWLCESADGKPPRRVLFFYDGRIMQTFETDLRPPPPPIPMPTVDMVHRLLRGLEEEQFFHRVVQELLGRRLPTVIAALFGLITIGFLLYGVKKLREGRASLETAAPSMVGAPAFNPSAAGIEERQRALLRKGDFGAQAHQLAAEWFQSEFAVTPDRWHTGVQAEMRAEGSLLARWRLRRNANYALSLARAGNPRRLSRHQFFMFVDLLKELSLARQAGRLALLVEGKNVRQP